MIQTIFKENQNNLFFSKSAFEKVKNLSLDEISKLKIISEMIRYNTLTEIMIANSGHLGASLSLIEALTLLYYKVMKINPENPLAEDRDIFILSKGHAASALYAILASLGYFSEDLLYKFRRLEGLEGHAEVVTPGIEANTGSLGMGISKAKGHAWAQKYKNLKNKVFVMCGDGELQEGQNWEVLQSAPAFKLGNLVLLIDKNEVQTDKKVNDLLLMPPIKEKLISFGWQVFEVNGHDVKELIAIFSKLDYEDEIPKAIILKTIKGKGVSFLESTTMEKTGGKYLWHDKIPNEEEFQIAIKELRRGIENLLEGIGINENFFPQIQEHFERISFERAKESVVEGYSRALLNLAEKWKDIVVLDADLAVACGIRSFEEKFPKRFIEVGIAEQDMVSMAGALARQGFLPIVNTFASFLTSRANEQIYNNQTEGKKIIYVGHLAGLLPATPGKSHQCLRDIALMRTMPNLILAEPCNSLEAEKLFYYLVEKIPQGCYLRLAGISGLGEIDLPKNYKINLGKGVILKDGKDLALISYGPIILPILLQVAEILAKKEIEVKVINFPWLNRVDIDWLKENLFSIPIWIFVENHMTFGGQGEFVKKEIKKDPQLKGIKLEKIGIDELPRSGNIPEILKYFKLDPESLSLGIEKLLKS